MQVDNGATALERMTYSVPDAARILGVGRNTAYEAVRNGDIRAVRIGGRVLVSKPEIERLLGGTAAQAA
jgi:excisionase family DNA binding protein